MIKRFNNYTRNDFDLAGMVVGSNPMICDDVIFHNPENIIIGDNVRIDTQSVFVAGKDTKIIIGDNCHVNSGCIFHGSTGNITLHSKVGIADKVVLYTSTFDYTIYREDRKTPGYYTVICEDGTMLGYNGDIEINSDVIVGCGTVILPNVCLYIGCTVGSNSLVKKSVERYTVVAGNPCRLIKYRISL